MVLLLALVVLKIEREKKWAHQKKEHYAEQ
jgi:hypothetical protein